MAVDASGDAWIPNEPNPGFQGNSVSVFNSSGQSVAGNAGFTAGGLNYPIAVAIDTDGSAWVADYGNSHLTHLSSSGQALSGAAGYTSPLLAFPDAVAIDGNHNVWVANQSRRQRDQGCPRRSQFTDFPCGDGPSGLAIDQLGNVWVANYYGNSVSETLKLGRGPGQRRLYRRGHRPSSGNRHRRRRQCLDCELPDSLPYRIGGATAATPGAVLSPSGGLGTDANLLEAYKIAVDASGNLWISNFGSNTLTQFVGLAPPVGTPQIGLPGSSLSLSD